MGYLELFRQVHTFIFDVDGVFTNNQMLVTDNGGFLRQMNVRDGYAVKIAVEQGYRVCIITGGKSEGVKNRFIDLGVTDIYLNRRHKMEAFEELVDLYDLDPQGILYMGDDLPDYPVMRKVGVPTCPFDAARELVPIAVYVSPLKGGQGCVRDVIEQVLTLHGKWGEL
ncbi:MAG: KdsC family phosphatase [Saprospiraceae bacterium]